MYDGGNFCLILMQNNFSFTRFLHQLTEKLNRNLISDGFRWVKNYFMVTSADWYFGLLCVNGKYRCLIMCCKEMTENVGWVIVGSEFQRTKSKFSFRVVSILIKKKLKPDYDVSFQFSINSNWNDLKTKHRLRSLFQTLFYLERSWKWNEHLKVSFSYLNLPLHCDAEKRYEVHDKDRPEDRDIENIEERADDSYGGGLGDCVPELELG